MDPLQLILIAGLALMALINIGSLVWAARLERRLRATTTERKIYEVHVDNANVFTAEDMTNIKTQAQQQLQQVATTTVANLQSTLDNAVAELSEHMTELATNTISPEFEKYQVSLQALREQSIDTFSKLQTELDKRRDQLISELERDIELERQKRIQVFNNRLNDVVSSYIAESLGTNVDLGAQTTYILQSLQQHKDDIKRDILT